MASQQDQSFIQWGRETMFDPARNHSNGARQQLKNAPLYALDAKIAAASPHDDKGEGYEMGHYALLGWRGERAAEEAENENFEDAEEVNRVTKEMSQVSIAGDETTIAASPSNDETRPASPMPIVLDVAAPWSAFLCGSQGSGKSHALSVMLENCLLPHPKLGRLPRPLAGMLFHYGSGSMGSVCEAVHLVSAGIEVEVLVPESNFYALKEKYCNEVVDAVKRSIRLYSASNCEDVNTVVGETLKRLTVTRLKFLPNHLDAGKKDGIMPLYMAAVDKVLRTMAIESQNARSLDYASFRRRLTLEGFDSRQNGSLDMRLQLLESFPSLAGNTQKAKKVKTNNPTPPQEISRNKSGKLTIVDLSDPFVDAPTACTLFDICLTLFLEGKSEEDGQAIGRVIALDEAHKSTAADIFTKSLLSAVRLQRHLGVRTIISMQEPTIAPSLIELCSMTLVHRFTSPAWMSTLQSHIAGLSTLGEVSEAEVQELFREIADLKVGESLLYSPSAMMSVKDRKPKTQGVGHLNLRTRPRVTNDGGRSRMAI